MAAAWKVLPTQAEREEDFARNGVRWSEFARLEYYDVVRMSVIDPMHNFLQGKALSLFC